MTSFELPWHNALWERYQRLVDQGILPHALLFVGVPGVGKRQFAERLIRYLLCHSRTGSGRHCGQCHACHLTHAETHPDVRYVVPEEKSSVVKVDQIRVCNEFVLKSSQQGFYKVAVVDPAEAMMTAAANALLKTLEEPPAKTLLLLISDRPGLILPTIRSRCQVVNFDVPASPIALDWLESQTQGGTSADIALKLAGGAPLVALDALASGDIEQNIAMTKDLASLLKREVLPSQVATSWIKQAGQPEVVVKRMLQWIQATLRFSCAGQDSLLDWMPGATVFRYLAEKNDSQMLFSVHDQLTEALVYLQQSNPNPTLLLEKLLFGWLKLMPGK
ncbi:MAG: DNA polymerase III subunit delta' [Hahellaceae bacterium]|nr:DNA polymerase III subunit delta' [Hahellaceae bacterium]